MLCSSHGLCLLHTWKIFQRLRVWLDKWLFHCNEIFLLSCSQRVFVCPFHSADVSFDACMGRSIATVHFRRITSDALKNSWRRFASYFFGLFPRFLEILPLRLLFFLTPYLLEALLRFVRLIGFFGIDVDFHPQTMPGAR